uniref:Disease resistance protein Roq1-like winged-helix domain-containing protein n=1 Tax=Lactuca sativa TaxID=4236 RepID=A0A9R1WGV9_LACSA|nr:hypothetical protein LSAT_V11C100040150 [Lactuca sativa]
MILVVSTSWMCFGNKGLHPGSKVIITTTDVWLPGSGELFKLNGKLMHTKYFLNGLLETESKKLLCFHAFMGNDPKEGYEEVSKKLVKYCEGHPMALKVLGGSLHNRDVTYWEGYIDMLNKENNPPINNVLKMSFDSLPLENDKELFKHISCFFVGMDMDVTVAILEACSLETRSGITNLIDKCLLSITWNKELAMPQLVQEMGRFVVREESHYNPWERSRLWGHESFNVLKHKKGTENVLGLTLDMGMLEKEKLHGSLKLKTDALSKMDRLMLLQLNYVQITGSCNKFTEELRWLCMHGFPLKSIPSNLPMENLVGLDTSYSNIESFGIYYWYPQQLLKRVKQWIGSFSKDKRLLGSLKILNLSLCEQLRSLGGFNQIPKIERLILKGCIGLHNVCQSIKQCLELFFVDLSYCSKLQKIPRIIGMLKKVETLLLVVCNLGESQIGIIDIDTITCSSSIPSTVLEAIPSYSKFFTIYLLTSLVSLSLVNNNLSTESFPMNFSCLSMLEELYLDKNPIVSMSRCVRSLPRLEKLSMANCNMLTSGEHPPHTLTYLDLFSCKPMLQKVVFDPEMSPLQLLSIDCHIIALSSCEVEGVVKIQPMAGVEEKVLRSLGWNRSDFLRHVMYYEFGIFSTIYEGIEMPSWIKDRSMGPSISFTIPSSPTNLTGLNFCCVLTS